MTPVFLGSAYKNKAVQALLDGVIAYLPNPTEVDNFAHDLDNEEAKVPLASDPTKPTVALAFKLEDGRYGQLTYMRVYQGALKKDDLIYNSRDGKKVKIGRLVRMHSDEMEDITLAEAGDIVAMFGVDCHSGDTFTDGTQNIAMSSMFVPNAVISVAIKPVDHVAEIKMSKALRRFTKEDPTFRVNVDEDSNETIIRGMGELHLEVYIERMKREFDAEVISSPPQVAYRETITQKTEFSYVHKKQTGGSGQYGKVVGYIEPNEEQDYEFIDNIKGGVIPKPFIPAVNKGFKGSMVKGRLLGFPVVNVRVEIHDGASHAVDSSEMAFQEAARGAWREAYDRAKPKILEPIMRVVVEAPSEHNGNVMTTLMQRRGMVVGSQEDDLSVKIEADVPLSEMFGYSTTLRSGTQGKAEFSMEFEKYAQVPSTIAEELIAKARETAAKTK
jgi:elongation factor G